VLIGQTLGGKARNTDHPLRKLKASTKPQDIGNFLKKGEKYAVRKETSLDGVPHHSDNDTT
jgi:hypothetical protein